ncbi:MAG: hypothetical protein IPO75_14355 [Betaproteobacteria bacterium]|nr:hypothetical protein [Betaproteobacteria bacterium]
MTSKTTTPPRPPARAPNRSSRRLMPCGACINALRTSKRSSIWRLTWLNNGWYEANHKEGPSSSTRLLLRRFEALLPHIYGDPAARTRSTQFPPE